MIEELPIRRSTPMMGTSDPQPSMFYHINLMACGVGKWAKGNGGSVAESVRKGFQRGLRRSARICQCRPVNGWGSSGQPQMG